MMKEIKATLGDLPVYGASLKGITVTKAPDITSHEQLEDRDLPGQHPASSITGIDEAIESALAEAKASGEFDGKDGVTITRILVETNEVTGVETYIIDFSDGNTVRISDGEPGTDGVSVGIRDIFHNEVTKQHIITFTDGTQLTVSDGKDGVKGDKGDKGDTGERGADGEKGDKGDTGATGKSAFEYAQDGGYSGTEADFAEKLAAEPLIGTVDDITPSQVAEAIAEGRPVAITLSALNHDYTFTAFDVRDNIIMSEMLSVGAGGNNVGFNYLEGSLDDNTWANGGTGSLAKMSDIPTVPSALKNPNALTINGTEYDGSSAVSIDIEGGGAEPLIGTTAEITPSQVAEAVAEGRPVAITHTDEDSGKFVITSFNYEANEAVVFGSQVLAVGDAVGVITLMGEVEYNSWISGVQLCVTPSGIPTTLPNPNALKINDTSYDGSAAVNITIPDTKVVRAAFTYYAEGINGIGGMRVTCDITPSELVGYMANKTVIAELTDEDGTYIGSAVFGKSGLMNAYADIVTAKGIYRITADSQNAGYSVDYAAISSGDSGGVVIFEEKTVSGSIVNNLSFELGAEYDIYWNDKKYVCTPYTSEGEVYTGNGSIINSNLTDTGEPFLFTHMAGASSCLLHKASGQASSNKLFVATHGYNAGGDGASIDVVAEVGQTIIVEEVDGFGKPTKWKAADYQPRTHWDEETVILPETTAEDAGGAQFPVSESAIPVVAGEEYVVNFNGTEYTVECVDMSDMVGVAGAKAFHLGSMELPPPEGEPPFGIMVMENVPDMGTMTMVTTTNEYEGTSITIGVKQVVAQKIPRQYLPNSAFYLKIRSTDTGYAIIGTPNEIDDALNSDSNVILRWIWSDTADMFLPFACREVFSDGRRFYTFYGFCALTNNYQGLRFIETAEGSNELEYYVKEET